MQTISAQTASEHTHSLQRAKLQPRSVVGRTDHTLEAAGQLVGDVSAQIGCKCGTSRRIGADRREDVSSYRPASWAAGGGRRASQGIAGRREQGKAAAQGKAAQAKASQGQGGVAAARRTLDLSPKVALIPWEKILERETRERENRG